MKLSIVLLTIIGLTTAGPVQKKNHKKTWTDLHTKDVAIRNSALEQQILNLLEELRQTMLTGTDDIPVLDPLEIQHIQLDGATLDLPGSHLNLAEVEVRHLSTFEVESLSLTLTNLLLQRYTLTFDGSIPSIDVYASDYDLNLSAMGFSVFGNGEASLRLIRPRLIGTVVVTLRLVGGISLNVNSVDLKLDLEAFESNIKGLFGDAGTSEFVNMFLAHLVPDLVRFYENEISSFLNETVLEIANQILSTTFLG